MDTLTRLLADRLELQLDNYTWHRHHLVERFLIQGPIRALNIGTGGGVETLRLLARGNHVTTIEVSEETAARTRARIERNGYGAKHTGLVGHVLKVEVKEQFHQIVMCEVLEHILDDTATLKRLSKWLLPGGRLILSTPTASYGQFLDEGLSLEEDGGHVRVGYDGPELDEMLRRVDLIPIRRVLNGSRLFNYYHSVEKMLKRRQSTRPLGYMFSVLTRPAAPLLDLYPGGYSDQITIATKLAS